MGTREIDLYRRPFADLAVDFDVTSGLFDEAIDLAQAKAGAMPRLLGREERVEGLFLHIPRHAGTGIAHGDLNILPNRNIGVLLRVALVDKSVAGLDRQFALAGHRVLGVHHKVEDRGLHLAGVDLALPNPAPTPDFHINFFT